MAQVRPTRALSTHRTTPDHERVEALLQEIEVCPDPRRKERLQQEVVVLTMELADRTAYRYRGRGIETDDLLQVARLALVKAVRGYRSGRGHSFAGYAAPTISGEIKRHFRDSGWAIRPPRRLQELRSRVAKEEERLRHTLGHEPDLATLAVSLDVTPREIEAARKSTEGYHTLSLDLAMTDGAPAHIPHAKDAYAALVEHDALVHALAELPERDRRIVSLRFDKEMTQSEIGRELGVSQMQVSRLLTSLLGRLRTSLQFPNGNDAAMGLRPTPWADRPVRGAARAVRS